MMITKRWFTLGAMGALLVAYGVGCGGGGGSSTGSAGKSGTGTAGTGSPGAAGDFGGQGQAGDFGGGQGQAGDSGGAGNAAAGAGGAAGRAGGGNTHADAGATDARRGGGGGGNNNDGGFSLDAFIHDAIVHFDGSIGQFDVKVATCAAGVMNDGKCTNVEACRTATQSCVCYGANANNRTWHCN